MANGLREPVHARDIPGHEGMKGINGLLKGERYISKKEVKLLKDNNFVELAQEGLRFALSDSDRISGWYVFKNKHTGEQKYGNLKFERISETPLTKEIVRIDPLSASSNYQISNIGEVGQQIDIVGAFHFNPASVPLFTSEQLECYIDRIDIGVLLGDDSTLKDEAIYKQIDNTSEEEDTNNIIEDFINEDSPDFTYAPSNPGDRTHLFAYPSRNENGSFNVIEGVFVLNVGRYDLGMQRQLKYVSFNGSPKDMEWKKILREKFNKNIDLEAQLEVLTKVGFHVNELSIPLIEDNMGNTIIDMEELRSKLS